MAFGWLQYDSVYNCCERDAEVVSSLFASTGAAIRDSIIFYDDDADVPTEDEIRGRRPINIDHMSEEDISYFRMELNPIFEKSYNNMEEEDILSIALALVRTSYLAAKQGLNIFENIDIKIFPLEAKQEYVTVAGAKGHIVDYEKNSKEMKQFLFNEDWTE